MALVFSSLIGSLFETAIQFLMMGLVRGERPVRSFKIEINVGYPAGEIPINLFAVLWFWVGNRLVTVSGIMWAFL